MTSFKKLQYLEQTASVITRENAADSDVVRASIYDLAIRGFMTEVLTLGRMNSVVQAVRNGIEDSINKAPSMDVSIQSLSQRQAYRGLGTAATEGLTATALALAQLRELSRRSFSSEFGAVMQHFCLKYKQQLDQINIGAGWFSSESIALQQKRWLDKLLYSDEQNSKQENMSAIPWSHSFFQECGYEGEAAKSAAKSNLMLLGLTTSGVLAGILASRAAV
jgi:hypothetical protein